LSLRVSEDEMGWLVARGAPADVVRGLIAAERHREAEMDVTDEQIRALEIEAGAAGDEVQVELCRRALDGDDDARAKCGRAIEAARAMQD
jgi:hypothetical protein